MPLLGNKKPASGAGDFRLGFGYGARMLSFLERKPNPADYLWQKCDPPWFETFHKDIHGNQMNPYSQTWRRLSADGKRWEYQQDKIVEEWWEMQW